MKEKVWTMYRHKKTDARIKMKLIEKNMKYVFILPLYSDYDVLDETEREKYGAISRKRFDEEYELIEYDNRTKWERIKSIFKLASGVSLDSREKMLNSAFDIYMENEVETKKEREKEVDYKLNRDYSEKWYNHYIRDPKIADYRKVLEAAVKIVNKRHEKIELARAFYNPTFTTSEVNRVLNVLLNTDIILKKMLSEFEEELENEKER